MRRLTLAVLLSATLSAPAHAWSRLGHTLIGRLADQRLSGKARKEVRRLLLGGDLASVANWADSIRNERRETGPWHYINVPVTGSIAEWRQYCPRDGCILGALDSLIGVLRDRARPDGERREALMFIVHFVGDLHQPLHVGERGDRGGNSVVVSWNGSPSNLHSVWDGSIVSSAGLAPDPWFGRLRKVANGLKRKEVERIDLQAWAGESLTLSRDFVYAIPTPPEVGGDYAQANLPRAEARLARAGLRLGALLTDILGK
ncbi:MAG: S1/P1 nuclease [Gemmatimonadales bacterium]|nr:S1/P1 nuclease [Gemmatimonadales bacterium]